MILVTGATGTVGGRVLDRLLAAGEKVRALTRDPERAALPAGVEVVGADLGVPASLPAALHGVDRVFLMSLGHHKTTHDGHLAAAARDAGVEHVVQLSTLGVVETTERESPLARWHRIAEEALRESGVGWTILRPNGFMTNALGWAASLKAAGVARGPFAHQPEAIIDPSDIAEVAVTVLTSPGHEGAIYSLTGPEAVTTTQMVATIAELVGRPLRFETIPMSAQREVMLRRFSADTVDGIIESALMADDEFRARLFSGVDEVLGRPPKAFHQWAREHAARFVTDEAALTDAVPSNESREGVR